jgi:hypothetical protein
MSALGQKQTWRRILLMSALPPIADMGTQSRNVRFTAESGLMHRSKELSLFEARGCVDERTHPSKLPLWLEPTLVIRVCIGPLCVNRVVWSVEMSGPPIVIIGAPTVADK